MTTVPLTLLFPLWALALLDPPSAPRTLARIAADLPREVGQFHAGEGDELFDPSSIYGYIDGAAEVYLAFGMRACLARRYHHPEGDIVLDIFEMADTGGAVGAFTYDRDGEELEIGQGALLRPGWLTLWQGRFFVSLTAEGESAAHREGLLAIARAAAAALGEKGQPPELLRYLPAAGMQPRSLRYLRHPTILASFLPLGAGDPLGLKTDTEAVLARYEGGEALLIVHYPNPTRAAAGLEGARQLLATPAPGGREGYWGAASSGRFLALVGEARSEAQVGRLLASVLAAEKTKEEHR